MSQITVSVIIPYFNAEKTLNRAIDSALQQAYPINDIILVDNNSTDASRQIAEEYKNKHPGKFILLSEQKQNANAARNKGLSVATGEWLQFLDVDDEILPDKIKNQIIHIHTESELSIVISPWSRYYYNTALNKWVLLENKIISMNITDGLIYSKLGITSANLWNKNKVIKAGGWNENLVACHEDNLLIDLEITPNNISYCNQNKTKVYLTPDSITRPTDAIKYLQILTNKLSYYDRVRQYLSKNDLLTSDAEFQLKEIMTKSLTNTFFLCFSKKDEVIALGKSKGVNITFTDKLKMYQNIIYSKYAFNTKHKYLNFIWYSIRNIYMLFY